MKAFLNFRNLSLALLICVVFSSCTKDTDLLSEYLIKDSKQIENLSSDTTTNATHTLD